MHVNVNSINSMATIIKFLPLDSEFLGVSHRNIPKKIKSEHCLPFANICINLVPEIFKFEKCVKYANERTDDVIHSNQYYMK